MARDAALFDEAGGSPVRGYILLKQRGGNIPQMWIERSRESRKNREKDVAKVLKKGGIADITMLEDWELALKKENFYHGIRCLLDLERSGKTKL